MILWVLAAVLTPIAAWAYFAILRRPQVPVDRLRGRRLLSSDEFLAQQRDLLGEDDPHNSSSDGDD